MATSPDTEAALRQIAATWLPTLDPAAEATIIDLLRLVAASGADPVAELRHALRLWFGPRAGEALPIAPGGAYRGDIEPGENKLPLEPLPPRPRRTMWPQRPKRLSGELFSSWLRRTALAAGVAPPRFARDVVGAGHDDIDRDLAPATLRRLAGLSGQTVDQLAAGMLVPNRSPETKADAVETLLLQDGRFLLARRGRDRQGRPRPVLQYCPRCLAEPGPSPFGPRPFQRAWRLAHMAACDAHGCRLHDRCWQCGGAISLLGGRSTDREPRCSVCNAALPEAPVIEASAALPRQRCLSAMLFYVAMHVPHAQRGRHLDALASVLRGRDGVEQRERALAGCRPHAWEKWFAAPPDCPDQDLNADILRRLAAGGSYYRLYLRRRRPPVNSPGRAVHSGARGSSESEEHRKGKAM